MRQLVLPIKTMTVEVPRCQELLRLHDGVNGLLQCDQPEASHGADGWHRAVDPGRRELYVWRCIEHESGQSLVRWPPAKVP